MSEHNKNLVRRFVRDVLNDGNPSTVTELLSEDFVLRLPGLPPTEGREAFMQALQEWRTAFPDWQVSIEQLIAEHDKVAGRWRCEATHLGPLMGIPATGKQVIWTANDILRIEQGKIAENTAEEDMLGLMGQLGAPPPSASPAEQVVRRFYDEFLNGGRSDVADELVAAVAELYFGPTHRATGPDGFRATHAATRGAFPDAAWTIEELIPGPRGAAARFTFTGTHQGGFQGLAPTGRTVSVGGIETYRLASGKIIENHVQLNMAGLLTQLGAQPIHT